MSKQESFPSFCSTSHFRDLYLLGVSTTTEKRTFFPPFRISLSSFCVCSLLGCIRTPLRIQEWDVGRRLDEKAGSGTYYEVLFENVWLEREAPADYMDVYNLV